MVLYGWWSDASLRFRKALPSLIPKLLHQTDHLTIQQQPSGKPENSHLSLKSHDSSFPRYQHRTSCTITMEDLARAFEAFVQRNDVPAGIMEALENFVVSPLRLVMEPTRAHEYDELEERESIGGKMMQALVEAQPMMDVTVTSVLWSLIMVAPMEQLRPFESSLPPHVLVPFLELSRTRLGSLLKTCELQSFAPQPSRIRRSNPHLTQAYDSPRQRACNERPSPVPLP